MGWLKTFIKGMATDKSSAYQKGGATGEAKAEIVNDGSPSLEELIASAVPSKQGLYPHEILMLGSAHEFKTKANEFQKYWRWHYSITDPQAVLDSLYERGFIRVDDFRRTLESLTVPQLKEELKFIDQKVTGKKDALIDRLLQYGDVNALSQKYPDRYYALTPKGEQELKDNAYVAYLAHHGYMSIWEMNKELASSKFSYRDIVWQHLIRQSVSDFENYDFGLYRNTRLSMYNFLMEKNRIEAAFHMLCEVMLYDLSGLGNRGKPLIEWEKHDPADFYSSYYKIILERYFPYKEHNAYIAPYVMSQLYEMQKKLNLDDNEYRAALLTEFNKIFLIRRIFTNEECADIVIADLHSDTDALTKIFKTAEKREKARIRDIVANAPKKPKSKSNIKIDIKFERR